MHGSGGRKREWKPMESSSSSTGGDNERNTHAHSYSHSSGAGGGGRNVQGEVIEKKMKKLRLAHDYDGKSDVLLLWADTFTAF